MTDGSIAHRPGVMLAFESDLYDCAARHRPHSHDALHFSIVLAGHLEERVTSRVERAGPLSVVAKDAGVMHADEFGLTGVRIARLTLASGTLGALLDSPARSTEWRWTHDPVVAAPFLRLVRRSGGQSALFISTDPDVIDLLAAFSATPSNPTRGSPPAWLVDVMRDVREGWSPGHSVAKLAADAGVHPVYLARCVRRWYGTSLGAELRRQRLRAAATVIAERQRTISDAAHRSGFADEPHLNREFKVATGLTPGQYRKLLSTTDRQRGAA